MMNERPPSPTAVRRRLLAAAIAIIAGIGALVIAIELVRTALA